MIRVLHVADVHLGASFAGFGSLQSERGAQLLRAFGDIPELVGNHGVDAVLVAGDLFDSPHPGDAVRAAAREVFRRLVEAGTPVFAVPGNHDPIYDTTSPYDELPEEVNVFRSASLGDPITVATGSEALHVYGVAYDPVREPDPLAGFSPAPFDGVHVVVLHCALQGAPHWGGGHALRVSREALLGLDVDYIALGDSHRHSAPAEFDPSGEIPACYAGSFAALDMTETGPHGYVVADLEPGQPPVVGLHISSVPPVLSVDRIDVSARANENEVAEAVAEALEAKRGQEGIRQDAYPSVTLVGQLGYPLRTERVTLALTERFGVARVSDETWCFDSDRLRELARENTIAGHVARLGAERVRAAAEEEERRLRERALRLALSRLEIP